MNSRIISVVILSIALLIYIGSFVSVPQDVWSSMSTFEWAKISFSLLTGLAIVLVGYWVYADYEELKRADRITSDSTNGKIDRLGEIVDGNFDLVFKRLEKIEEKHKKEEKQEKDQTQKS